MPPHSTFTTTGGATIHLNRWALWHRWTCRGCRTRSKPTINPTRATSTANQHAEICHANPR